jgi:hypothetical protein
MVIVKNCYENFEGGKPVNACNSEYFPQEIQKKNTLLYTTLFFRFLPYFHLTANGRSRRFLKATP